ncbi:aspartyl protease family protein [Massilia yuzhufengensis]|uniref:Aspartyl protease n=1 Tax=Massilia yuzhufengensis TaxID=1164594 RepID=A0A1I1QJN1_9BURK|nr:aspartyl protease family protein [Massilia yuzhufengensis]SFD18310.1 Aspartyl protease [Massilia yuzhufengensis]
MNPILCRALTRLTLGAACAFLPLAHAAAEAAKCSYTPIGKLPLRYSGPSLEITTEGTINGTPAELLVDTGAYATVLTRTGTERRGIRLYATGRHASGVGGSSPLYASIVNEFIVGPVRAGRSNMPVLGSFGDTPSYDGILGAPFLFQTDLEISLATRQLTFFVPKGCGGVFLGYWGQDVQEVPLRRHNEDHMNPHFFVRINGKELEAMIDTGAAFSMITGDAARRAGIALDAPGVERGTDIVGVGSHAANRWFVKTRFQIGEETVENADMAVENSGLNSADVILGADFLRAHRVLFAMSQNKLYFSYVGGAPFGQRRTLEPWMVAEAEGGNADAQLVLARAYSGGKLVARDRALAGEWLEKAAQGGSAHAKLYTGHDLLERRDYAGAATRLRAGLDKLPAERHAALWLYIARVKSGQAELAKSELATIFARTQSDEWPKPIGEFYLGSLAADKLLAQAGDDRSEGKGRRCEALSAMADWHRAHGQAAQASTLDAQVEAGCGDTGRRYDKLGD